MFGYIRIQKSELRLREYEAYKGVYCGLCRQLGRDYSIFSRFLLSYDCTFYGMFIMSLGRSCSGFERKRCRFNPMKKCTFCKCESDSLSKASPTSSSQYARPMCAMIVLICGYCLPIMIISARFTG